MPVEDARSLAVAAAALDPLLDSVCPLFDAASQIAACPAACFEDASRTAHPQHIALASFVQVGFLQGIPVFLAHRSSFDAASLSYQARSGEPAGAIVLTTGVVEQLSGPLQGTALRFILWHEAAHLLRGDVRPRLSGLSAGPSMHDAEEQADLEAFRAVLAGTALHEVASSIELVFSLFESDSDPLPAEVRAMNAARLERLRRWIAGDTPLAACCLPMPRTRTGDETLERSRQRP